MMGYFDKADDWQCCEICQVGGAAGFGGGIWLFQIQSYNSGQYAAYFAFAGFGIGIGGSVGGASLPANLFNNLPPGASALSFSDLACDTAFSADDLDCAPGRLTTGGVSAMVGYSVVYISAKNLPFTSLFASQSCNGLSVGVGADAMTTVGFWKYVQDAPYQVVW